MDLTDYSSVENSVKKIKPDIIFHLVVKLQKQVLILREVTFDTNILGTDRLLNSVLQLKLNPIIHICSSSEIFGK